MLLIQSILMLIAGGQFTVSVEPVFTVEVEQPVAVAPVDHVVALTPPARYIQWNGYGTIDLERYAKNCSCPMCNSIRAMQQTYRVQLAAYQASLQPAPESVAASQESTPDAVVTQTVEQLQLQPTDVVADLGCGDARILIAAVRRYKCRGVGIEIDSAIAENARRRVRAAGMSSQITIITGDALQFDPDRHGVTAVTAYLYPELLRKLLPKFRSDRIMVVATPYHEVPGLTMVRSGDVYVWRRKVTAKRRQQFLVSELWCPSCPAAKARFKALGWPEENILTIAECRRRFGFSVPHVPYLFDDPEYQ